jgi:large subunit ribosomal protein L11
MKVKQEIEALVEGGKASSGPPLGPALGPLGVNISKVVDVINEKTKDYQGMKVPVKVIVDTSSKEFEIEVGSPPTSALILKELGAEKGSGDAIEPIGNLSFESLKKIAKMKKDSMLAVDLKAAVKEVLGTCLSMGVTVDGKSPKVVQSEISQGLYDDKLAE